MIFTDSQRNIKVDVTDISFCKVSMINDDLKQLNGLNRLLIAYVRQAPLDGGTSVHFEHELMLEEKNIFIKGNLIEAARALNAIDRISDQIQTDIIEEVLKNVISQALLFIPNLQKKNIIGSIKDQLDLDVQPRSPKLFS